MYKFETKTDADGVINQVVNHKPNGFNPTTGVYSSNYIFQGDWQDELDALMRNLFEVEWAAVSWRALAHLQRECDNERRTK